jgi:hypothetical protein
VTSHLSPTKWTHLPDVDLAWDAPPEQAEGTSPIDFARWDLLRPGGTSQDGAEVDQLVTSATANLPAEGLWELNLRFQDEAGNPSDRSYDTIGFDNDAPTKPELEEHSWLSRDQLIAGFVQSWTPAEVPTNVESGVEGFAFSTNEDELGSPPVRIDAPKDATGIQLPVLSAGKHYAHVRSVSGAEVGSLVDTALIQVDAAGPTPLVTGIPAGGWSPSSAALEIHAGDGDGAGGPGSGTTSITYKLDTNAPTVVAGNSAQFTAGAGNHVLTVSAVDAVGNLSGSSTYAFAVDPTAPSVAIGTRDPAEPQHLSADLSDADSGIRSASLEYRVGGVWRPLYAPDSLTTTGPHSAHATFTIHDETLPAGTYEFRVTAEDAAGNVGSDELPAVQLPLRSKTRLFVGVADVVSRCRTDTGDACSSLRSCPRGKKCRMRSVTLTGSAARSVVRAYDADTALVGQAVGADGRPLAGVDLDVATTEFLSAATAHRNVKTDASGRFEVGLPQGAGRDLSVRFAGDSLRLPVTSAATLKVRAGITLAASSKVAHGGDVTRLRGTIRGGYGRVPDGGMVLRLQFYSTDGWSDFGKKFRTDERGRFTASRAWPRSGRRSAVLIRVHADADRDFPFAEGSSDPVKIRLLP